MTNREQEILNAIRKNPLISQNELAEMFGITRSSAAVHITNLIKKGYIQGKGYIVQEESYVLVVGGANIDITGFPYENLRLKDSNPGKVSISLGGVGRNIAENLCKLVVPTKLITAIGDDLYGQKILEDARQIGLDMQQSLILKEHSTSTYLAVLDEQRDMRVAIAFMDIIDKLSINFIKEKKHIIDSAKICVVDTNLSKEVLEYIVVNHKNTQFLLDTVSTAKAMKVKDIIGYFHTIKPNKIEAEKLTGIKIKGGEDLRRAANCLLEKGVKRVIITLGEEGVYYNDGKEEHHITSPKIKVVNATGAGDAFMAALAYCGYYNLEAEYSIKFSMAASILALSHEATINPNMSVESVKNKMLEI